MADAERLYGLPGSAIAGSLFVRDYCSICGEPIRVAEAVFEAHRKSLCSACDHSPPGRAATKDDIGPWQENAIRIMEDG